MQETQPVTLSRRQLVRVAGLGTIGLVGGLLAACSAPAPAAPAAPAAPPPTAVVPPLAKATEAPAASPTLANADVLFQGVMSAVSHQLSAVSEVNLWPFERLEIWRGRTYRAYAMRRRG